MGDLKQFIESNNIKRGDIFIFELKDVDAPIMAQLVSINDSTIDVNFPYMNSPFPFNSYANASLKQGTIFKVGSSFEALKYLFRKTSENSESNPVTVLTYKDEKGVLRVAAGRAEFKSDEKDRIKIRPFSSWRQMDNEVINNLQTANINFRQVVTIYHLDSYIYARGFEKMIADKAKLASRLLEMQLNTGK